MLPIHSRGKDFVPAELFEHVIVAFVVFCFDVFPHSSSY
jgi:hypothetical protein